ncbi:hypothetical protein HMPREF1544_03696 [Mucor circinelloides 1006PhL]|uniref:F-box domain-containing protein n=1 Tax=Mucor circinelloides f. circinelloides (strain 1006PhL) TaxID=1220926 RepID=S2KAZ3_MUCC1|nr:hypothetical protein HMPREF1544_03696 [Mucor circinelloides 1006PhL]
MERLPSEIRYAIFSNVYNLKQCRLVSKSWYSMITDDLLHRFVIISSTAGFALYEKHPDLANHVRQLYCMLCPVEKALALSHLFPNLRHLDFNAYITDARMDTDDHHSCQIQSLAKTPYWTSSITVIKERNYLTPSLTSLWLEAAMTAGEKLANLRVLRIGLFDYEKIDPTHTYMRAYMLRKQQFLRSLQFAHSLQQLTLDRMHVSLQDLDIIHENAPTLQSLALIDTTLRLNQNAAYPYYNVDQQIEHVNSHVNNDQVSSLKRLEINLHSGKGLNGPQPHEIIKCWIKHVALKYTDLTSFTLHCNISMRSTSYTDEHTLRMLPMIASCQRLQTFNTILFPITKDLLQAMDRNKIKLRTLGFETITSTSLKNQLTRLSDSDQSNHIQHLKIQSNYAGGYHEYNQKRALKKEIQRFEPSLFQPLSGFPQLTSLEFKCTFGRSCELAQLIQILTHCKSLESLALDHVSVSDVPDILQHSVATNLFISNSRLRYLAISKLDIKRGSGTLVETNLILRNVLEGLQGSLREIRIDIGSITEDQNRVSHALADNLYLDLSKSQELRGVSVRYTLGSSVISTERGGQCETHEFGRNNRSFKKITLPNKYVHETKIILPQQSIKINTLLVL